MHQCDIRGTINALDVQIGRGVVVEEGVYIGGKGGPATQVILGDYCYIGRDTRILCPEFRLGHYSKLNEHSFCHGTKPLQIGRNCWIGGYVTLDSIGGLDIDDNVGIGGHSQIWTHIQFGDVVEGSRFCECRYMHIQKDAWFVGQCLVSPVKVGERSMALLGSVVTRDMQPNHIYAGVPAVDVTEKMGGGQFEERSVGEKAMRMLDLIHAFELAHPEYRGALRATTTRVATDGYDGITTFDVSTRTYTRTNSDAEVAFLKAHVPLVKFTAADEPSFIQLQNVLQMEAV